MDLFESLKNSVRGFPRYIVQWVGGLVVVVLTDLHMTALAVTGLTVGWATKSPRWGVAAFFVAYTASRVIGNLADAVGHGLRAVSEKHG